MVPAWPFRARKTLSLAGSSPTSLGRVWLELLEATLPSQATKRHKAFLTGRGGHREALCHKGPSGVSSSSSSPVALLPPDSSQRSSPHPEAWRGSRAREGPRHTEA